MNTEQQYLECHIQYYAIYFLKRHLEQNYNPSLPGVNLDFFVDLQKQEITKINQEMSVYEENNLSDEEKNIRNAYKNLSEEITKISKSKEIANLMSEKTRNIIYNSEDGTIYIPDGIIVKNPYKTNRNGEFKEGELRDIFLNFVNSERSKFPSVALDKENRIPLKNFFEDEKWENYYKQIFMNTLSIGWKNKVEIANEKHLEEIKRIENNINKAWQTQGAKTKIKLIDKNKKFVAKFFIKIQPLEINDSRKIARYRVSAEFQDWILWGSLSIDLKKQILSLLYQEIDYKRTNITQYFTDENYISLGFTSKEIKIINLIMIKKNNGETFITIEDIINTAEIKSYKNTADKEALLIRSAQNLISSVKNKIKNNQNLNISLGEYNKYEDVNGAGYPIS